MPRNENQLKASLRVKESELTRARLALRSAMKKRADLEALIDDVGLYGIIQVNPSDQDAMNCRARTLRGDVDQASFGFEEYKTEWTDNPDGTRKKVIKEISKLWEISVCTFPAYEATAVSARSKIAQSRAERESARYRDYLKRRLHHAQK